MKQISLLAILIIYISAPLFCQDNKTCNVLLENIKGNYTGECKKGLAHGNGEAKGFHTYKGAFKYGLPNGKGVYTYSSEHYFEGNFQDGIKEGKGEEHFLKKDQTDSVIKGYWSGDMYRGSKYETYKMNGATRFEIFEAIPSDKPGNTISFNISTNSGSPDGTNGNLFGSSGYVLTVQDVISMNGNLIRKVSDFSSASKYLITYAIPRFPEELQVILSNGTSFNLELYKAADWNIRIFVNK